MVTPTRDLVTEQKRCFVTVVINKKKTKDWVWQTFKTEMQVLLADFWTGSKDYLQCK